MPFTAYFNIAIGKSPTGALSNHSVWTLDILACYYLFPDQQLVGSQNNDALSKASELECCIIKREEVGGQLTGLIYLIFLLCQGPAQENAPKPQNHSIYVDIGAVK